MYTRKVVLFAVVSLTVQLAAASEGAKGEGKPAQSKLTDKGPLKEFEVLTNEAVDTYTRGAKGMFEPKDNADKATWAKRRAAATPLVQQGRADLSKKYDEIVKDLKEDDDKKALQAALDDAMNKLAALVDDPDVVAFRTAAAGIVDEARAEVEKVPAADAKQSPKQRDDQLSKIITDKKAALKKEYDAADKLVKSDADAKAQLDEAYKTAQEGLDKVAAGESNAAVSSKVAVSAIAVVVVAAIAA